MGLSLRGGSPDSLIRAILIATAAGWGCQAAQPASVGSLLLSVTTQSGPATIVGTAPSPCQLDVDFGSVPIGVASTGLIQISNQGRKAVTLTAPTANLAPAFSEMFMASQAPLAPGASLSFPVSFQPVQAGAVSASFSIPTSLTAGTCGSSSSILINLTGTGVVVGPLLVTPSSVDFGNTIVNTKATKTVTLSNSSGSPIATITCALSGASASYFTVSGCPSSLAASGSTSVVIGYQPLALETRSIAMVTFTGEGSAVATLGLAGEPIGVGVTLAPNPIDFGYVTLQNTIIGCTTATNQASMSININGVTDFANQGGVFALASMDDSTPPNPFSLPLTLAGGQSAKVCFSFTPTATQDYTMGQATLSDNDPSGNNPIVQLTGWGGGPQITCAPLSLPFGKTLDNSRTTMSVICSNSGTANGNTNLTIEPPTASPGVFTALFDQSMDPYPLNGLAPGASAQIDVTYSPTANSSDMGTLVVQSNGGQGKPVSIALSGQGLDIAPCQFVISPASLNFGNVGVGSLSIPLSFEIENVGSDICFVQSLAITDDLSGSFHILSTSIAPDPQTQWITIPAPAPGVDASLLVTLDFSPAGGGIFGAEAAFKISSLNDPNQVVQLIGTSEATCLWIQPASLNFGSVGENGSGDLCASQSLAFTVFDTCETDATVQVLTIQSGPGDLAPQFSNPAGPPLPDTFNGSSGGMFYGLTFTLTFTPTTLGTHTGQLLVSDGMVTMLVELRGAAVSSPTATDSFVVGPPKADVLFVMDVCDDPSAATDLQDAGAGFFQGAGSIDYRVAVTTDNVGTNDATAELGNLLPCPSCSVMGPSPTIIGPTSVPPGGTSADPAAVFADLVGSVPTNACPPGPPNQKQFFLSLYDALLHVPPPGVDFFRQGAAFAAITTNDDTEDDSSQLGAGGHDAAWYVGFFQAFFTGGPGFSWNYMSAGTTPNGTGYIDPTLWPNSIGQMLSATGGIAVNTSDSSWQLALDGFWSTFLTTTNAFRLTGTPSEGPTGITVSVNGNPVAENAGPGNPNWTYQANLNEIVFNTNTDPPRVGDRISVTYPISCQ